MEWDEPEMGWDVVSAVMNFAPLIRRGSLPSINTTHHLRARGKKSETNPALPRSRLLNATVMQHSDLTRQFRKSKTMNELSCKLRARVSIPLMENLH